CIRDRNVTGVQPCALPLSGLRYVPRGSCHVATAAGDRECGGGQDRDDGADGDQERRWGMATGSGRGVCRAFTGTSDPRRRWGGEVGRASWREGGGVGGMGD